MKSLIITYYTLTWCIQFSFAQDLSIKEQYETSYPYHLRDLESYIGVDSRKRPTNYQISPFYLESSVPVLMNKETEADLKAILTEQTQQPKVDTTFYSSNPFIENDRIHVRTVGESYDLFVWAEGWYSFDQNRFHFFPLLTESYQLPYLDYYSNNYFIKYKEGKPVNGIIDEYNEQSEGVYNLQSCAKNGRLDGVLRIELDGKLKVKGQLIEGYPIGLWEYYNDDNTRLTTHLYKDTICTHPNNISYYNLETQQIIYSRDYFYDVLSLEIDYYNNENILSIKELIDEYHKVYSWVKYHPNGTIMETGKLIETILKRQKIGTWEYYDENNELIKTETYPD